MSDGVQLVAALLGMSVDPLKATHLDSSSRRYRTAVTCPGI